MNLAIWRIFKVMFEFEKKVVKSTWFTLFDELFKLYCNLKIIRQIDQIFRCFILTIFFIFFSNSDSDDEEYWFQNADPKRPKINQPPVKNVPKRIFHKLEPQVRPTLEQISPSNLVNNVRLPRKTISNKESPDLI